MTDEIEIQVVKVKSLITFSPNPLRHPVLWWRLRHLRADLKRPRPDLILPEIEARFDRQIGTQPERTHAREGDTRIGDPHRRGR